MHFIAGGLFYGPFARQIEPPALLRRRGLGRAANMDLLLRRALRRERGAACLEECHEKEAAACASDGRPGRLYG